MIKDASFRDEPLNPNWNGVDPYDRYDHIYLKNVPGIHEIIKEMRHVIDEFPDRVMVGETYLPVTELGKYYGAQMDECHLPFFFGLIPVKWEAQNIRQVVETYLASLPEGAWPNFVLGNHDVRRLTTRAGQEKVRLALLLLLTLRGTPTIYQGEEIGMQDVAVPPERWQDPRAIDQAEIGALIGRDPERTPMQWDASPNAGFSGPEAKPWLPLADNYADVNVALQESLPNSLLSFVRRLTDFRQVEPALYAGEYQSLESGSQDVLAYIRASGADRFVVALNFSSHAQLVHFEKLACLAQIVIETGLVQSGPVELTNLALAPYQGLVLRLLAA
jgi:alpha-glucosidase